MINKTFSKQDWTKGNTVKVGFMHLLIVDAKETPGDYKPDAYLLKALNKDVYYEFVPHNGLNKLRNKNEFYE